MRLRVGELRRPAGVTVVEFALSAPVLFLFIFAMIEFGRIVMVQQLIVTAAREGARMASLATTTDSSQVDPVVRNLLSAGGIPSPVAHDPTRVRVTVLPPGSYSGMPAGAEQTVSVHVPVNDIAWLNLFMKDRALQAAATMQRE